MNCQTLRMGKCDLYNCSKIWMLSLTTNYYQKMYDTTILQNSVYWKDIIHYFLGPFTWVSLDRISRSFFHIYFKLICTYSWVCMYVFQSLKQRFYNEKIAMINNVEPAYKTQINWNALYNGWATTDLAS